MYLSVFAEKQMITMGGNAEIELIDSMDPFSEGMQLDAVSGEMTDTRCRFIHHATEEVLASDRKFVRRREDSGFTRSCIRVARFQAHSALLHGRN